MKQFSKLMENTLRSSNLRRVRLKVDPAFCENGEISKYQGYEGYILAEDGISAKIYFEGFEGGTIATVPFKSLHFFEEGIFGDIAGAIKHAVVSPFQTDSEFHPLNKYYSSRAYREKQNDKTDYSYGQENTGSGVSPSQSQDKFSSQVLEKLSEKILTSRSVNNKTINFVNGGKNLGTYELNIKDTLGNRANYKTILINKNKKEKVNENALYLLAETDLNKLRLVQMNETLIKDFIRQQVIAEQKRTQISNP